MFLRNFRDIAKPQVVAIIDLLKRSTGMSVGELAKELKMSYMGVKQHCVDLEKRGYVDTWRRPKPIGRPEKSYRLTSKANVLFPEAGNEVTLEILKTIQLTYGANAPDKLLFNYFERKTEDYLKKVEGETVAERAAAFARIRDAEGYFSEDSFDTENGFAIHEYHDPMRQLAEAYPSIRRMEETMFSRILNADVTKTEESAAALMRSTYKIHAVAEMAPKPAAIDLPVAMMTG